MFLYSSHSPPLSLSLPENNMLWISVAGTVAQLQIQQQHSAIDQ